MAEKFVSGVFQSEFEFRDRPRTFDEIIGRAVKARARRKALHQPYSSTSTLAIQRATYRMVGEKHPVDVHQPPPLVPQLPASVPMPVRKVLSESRALVVHESARWTSPGPVYLDPQRVKVIIEDLRYFWREHADVPLALHYALDLNEPFRDDAERWIYGRTAVSEWSKANWRRRKARAARAFEEEALWAARFAAMQERE